MRNEKGGTNMMAEQKRLLHRQKLRALLQSDPAINVATTQPDETNLSLRQTNTYDNLPTNSSAMSPVNYYKSPASGDASPSAMSPWNHPSPYTKSPWIVPSPLNTLDEDLPNRNGLICSFVRKDGHIYSLAVSGDLLYTGSDSKNIRVWKSLKEFSGFKSNSGLVKSIVIAGYKIFTGHQDGKIRVWELSSKKPGNHKRIGTLPTFKDSFKCSMNPKNYIEVRRHRSVIRIKHFDAVSCMSLNKNLGLLYSASWDKTLKVWRIADSKCLESITAHEDAVNSVVSAFDCLVFTGAADGTVKVWRREMMGKQTKHVMVQVLMKHDSAVTSLAVSSSSATIYCGTSDGGVNYWEREKRTLRHGGVLQGHKMAVLCLVTAGSLVFSGSADKNICVWRREEDGGGSHIWLSMLTGHSGPVKCLAVEEDRQGLDDENVVGLNGGDRRWIVYSGSLDKSVKVWRVAE